MRIVIDMQGAQSASRFRGIGRYSISFAQAVIINNSGHEIYLALSNLFPETIESIRADFSGILPQDNIRVWDAPGPVREIQLGIKPRREIAEVLREDFLKRLKPDVVHITSLFEGYLDDAVTSIKKFDEKTAVSVSLYDLIPYLNPAKYLDHDLAYKAHYMRKIQDFKKADRFLAISEHSKIEAIRELGLNELDIVNVSSAIDSIFQPSECTEDSFKQINQAFGINQPYILYTGASDARKNIPRLIEAYSLLPINLRKKFKLVLAGGMDPSHTAEFIKLSKSVGLDKSELIFTGHVTDKVLINLYSFCYLYVFPSWHEGFGLPVLEAMACGAPVIASNTSSIPEVVEFTEALFDPFDSKSIADKILHVLNDASFRKRLCDHGRKQSKKFSWSETAKRAILCWSSIKPHSQDSYRTRALKDYLFYDKLTSEIETENNQYILELSQCIAQNQQNSFQRQLLLDISSIDQNKLSEKLNIIKLEFLKLFLGSPTLSFRVEPIYIDESNNYKYARNFVSKILGTELPINDDNLISWQAGDHLFLFDTNYHGNVNNFSLLKTMIESGVVVKSFFFDETVKELQGLQHSSNLNQFNYELINLMSKMDGILCVNNTSAEALNRLILINCKTIFHASFIPNGVSNYLTNLSLQTPIHTENLPHYFYEIFEIIKSFICQPSNKCHQLFIDVSELVKVDARTGIQRVVRSILLALFQNPPAGYRIEPVYSRDDSNSYFYAKSFKLNFLGISGSCLSDAAIEYLPGDLFFCLDFQPQIQISKRNFFNELRINGVRVKFLVYDLITVLHPQFFPRESQKLFYKWLSIVAENDAAICISSAVANDLNSWINRNNICRSPNFRIGWFHLGANIDHSLPTKGFPRDADIVLKEFLKRPTFLMVGTLEPRKGHEQVLSAFNILWQLKENVNLVIVGKSGWLVDSLVKDLNNHPELNRRLFWFKSTSDEFLEKIYSKSTCLIAASRAEGFGLPLIEAAQYKLPIIARDIPAFREVAGAFAHYFDSEDPLSLARIIQSWIKLFNRGAHPSSEHMPYLTWKESANDLCEQLLLN